MLRSDNIQINYAPGLSARPLHYAVRQNDVFYVEKLVQHPNTNVNITSVKGTPLVTIMDSMRVIRIRERS